MYSFIYIYVEANVSCLHAVGIQLGQVYLQELLDHLRKQETDDILQKL